ncbi:GroES-like protein [Bimuria novae-zelandiae CBS 107.79]|uniref:GroES-like protein n=1 Tax=Bimuria novae-zelandiae CBS 107.79 TaxID=1447943 RepID=A0A6A5W0Z9_9PLEO|nr:GroES-like protein [Bimuria novae-zelandiae CBS 107.79]
MPVPASHRAAFVHGKGEAPKISERTLGEVKPDQVAIKILATAINPVDWKLRDYGLFIVPGWDYPAIFGSDGAGTVAALGSEVKDFEIGERVFFQSGYGNPEVSTFQEYIKLPAAVVAKTPSSLSDEEAAGVVVATMAGATGFYDVTGRGLIAPWSEGGNAVGKGKAVVILGGASSVGQYAVQLARLSGFEKIVTNASKAHHEWLKELGAHVVLDRHAASSKDFVDALEGYPLEFVFDSISVPQTQKVGVEVLQKTGTKGSKVVTVGMVDEEAKKMGEEGETKVDVNFIMGIALGPKSRGLITALTTNLGGEDGWIAQGLFKSNKVEVIEGGLEKLQEGMERNKGGVSGAKVIVKY